MADKKLVVLPYVDISDMGGGMVTSIRRLLKNLSSLGWSGVIISELSNESHLKNTKYHNFDVEYVTPVTETWVPLKHPYRLFRFWAKSVKRATLLSKVLRESNIRLIYVTGPPSFPLTGHLNNITGWMLPHTLGRAKVVIGVRGASSSWLSNPLLIRIFHWEEATQIKAADQFVCVDHYILDENFPESFRAKGQVITNTVETDKFFPMPGKENPKCVMFAGHLTEARGIWVFMEAVKLLKGKDFRFILIGKGALEQEVREFIKENKLDIEMRGAVSYEKMCEMYNEAAVVVNPSPAEGIGNITLEAMACGKCVIRTRSKTRNYAIENLANGLLFNRNDPENLARIIEFAMGNPDKRKAMGAAARETILKEYTEKVEAERYDKLFSILISDLK